MGSVESETHFRSLREAVEADVPPILEQLTDHMNTKARARFKDKLERYIRKPDRALIIAIKKKQIPGLVCVIEQMDPPAGLEYENSEIFASFAASAQLLVHPEKRRQGIGKSLHQRSLEWAQQRGCKGHWLITRRMADWYKKHFRYVEICRFKMRGTRKTALMKRFDSDTLDSV